MKRSGTEGTAVYQTPGEIAQIGPMRRRSHGQLDRVCNRVINEGRHIRGIAVIVTSRDAKGIDWTNWDALYENNQNMASAIDLAAFRLKLGAFDVITNGDV